MPDLDGRPFALFISGWGTSRGWAEGWSAYLAPTLAAAGLLEADPRPGVDHGVFAWGGPSWVLGSALTPTALAARRLARQLEAIGRRSSRVTVIAHSKGANVLLEYLARVAEGRLAPCSSLRVALALNAPLDCPAGWAAVAPLAPRRLSDLGGRLVDRGMSTRVLLVHDPGDPVNPDRSIDGLPRISSRWGSVESRGRLGSFQFWHPNHMACLRCGLSDVLGALPADGPGGGAQPPSWAAIASRNASP